MYTHTHTTLCSIIVLLIHFEILRERKTNQFSLGMYIKDFFKRQKKILLF